MDEIQGVISINKCDILVLTESWLTSKVSNDLITIPDYNNIRKDRPNDQRGGGICTYLKRSIGFLYLHEFDDPSFETQWFLLRPNRLPRGINSIIMITIYRPPVNDDYALRNHIFQFLDRALNRYPNSGIVLLGDFNQFNPGSLCSSFKLKKAVHLPTRENNTLDQIYTSLGDFYEPATILPPISKSDHACVILTPKMYCANSLPSRRSFERSCRPSEKQAFTESLSKINWRSLYDLYTPTEKINVFMTQVAEKMDENLPMRYVKRHPMDKPWITPDIKIAIKKRQHYWLKGFFHEYTFYRNKTRKLCRQARRLFYLSTVKDSQNCNPRKWWNNIKRLAGLSKRQPLTSIYHNGHILKGNEMVEHIADSFCYIAKDIPPLNFTPIEFASVPDRFIISPNEVRDALSTLKVYKAHGPDNIPNWLLKSNADTLCSPLSSIFNASISHGKVPSLWKSADVLGIPKTNKSSVSTDDLRPISLTPTVSKILEGFVFKWLAEQIIPHIDPYQFGNVRKCSITHALIHLIHRWLAATDASGFVVRACMVDFSKAFDRMNHNMLIKKLQIPTSILVS